MRHLKDQHRLHHCAGGVDLSKIPLTKVLSRMDSRKNSIDRRWIWNSCKMELPQSWESLRQDLLSLQSGAGPEQKGMYYIDRQTFHSLCDWYAVPADDGLRAWLLTWFNDLGGCFSYHLGEDGQERSADYKILDPMWLTSTVYKIIWEKEQTDDGLITRSEIHRILEKPGSDTMKKDGIPLNPSGRSCLNDESLSAPWPGSTIPAVFPKITRYPFALLRLFVLLLLFVPC